MRRRIIIWLVLSISLISGLMGFADESIIEIYNLSNRMSAKGLWPGYEASKIPAIIYDGQNSYLFSHPAPPSEFKPFKSYKNIVWVKGLHQSIRANTSIELKGVLTAAVMLGEKLKRCTKEKMIALAALLLHEKFHAYQRKNHKDWRTNEGVLFLYPFADDDLLAIRRLETEALRRSAKAEDRKQMLKWLCTSLKLRKKRFSRMKPEFAEYERGIELVEGTATYVEYKSQDFRFEEEEFEKIFKPEEVRRRSYTTGVFIAYILDRLDPEWKAGLITGKHKYLDQVAWSLVKVIKEPTCFPEDYVSACKLRAKNDIQLFLEMRKKQVGDFLKKKGYKIILNSNQPLMPAGFDPMNVMAVGKNKILHKRFLKLQNNKAYVEVLNHTVMTEGTEKHPLFYGVREMVITGLKVKPVFVEKGGKMVLILPGYKLELIKNTRIKISGDVCKINILPD